MTPLMTIPGDMAVFIPGVGFVGVILVGATCEAYRNRERKRRLQETQDYLLRLELDADMRGDEATARQYQEASRRAEQRYKSES